MRPARRGFAASEALLRLRHPGRFSMAGDAPFVPRFGQVQWH
jgi:hypothetical protein